MNGLRKAGLWLALLAIFAAGYWLGITTGAAGARAPGQVALDPALVPLVEAWDFVRSQYVSPPDDDLLLEGALNGLMDVLDDPFSFYMTPQTFKMLNSDLEGRFEGIGASVRQDVESGGLVIVSTMPGSPAEQADVRSGDIVIEVDGDRITDLPQSEIIALIRGARGTTVELGIQREGETELIRVPVVRSEIEIPSVEARPLDGGVAYIRLYQFGADTASELREQLSVLNAESGPGLVLDFRGNPGGYLSTAVEVASEFVLDGVIVTERGRDGEQVFRADGAATAPTVPMVVLVDEGSASASELVAGALQDLGRATIVGTPTFGKGSVQTWRELSNGGGVRITNARWYTPADRTIAEVGLTPDVFVEYDLTRPDEDVQLEAALRLLTEARQGVRP